MNFELPANNDAINPEPKFRSIKKPILIRPSYGSLLANAEDYAKASISNNFKPENFVCNGNILHFRYGLHLVQIRLASAMYRKKSLIITHLKNKPLSFQNCMR